jgi:hypothetical protein
VLLDELRELVSHAAEWSDAAAAAEGARGGEPVLYRSADELALVGHCVEDRGELRLDLERDDVLCRAGFAWHVFYLGKTQAYPNSPSCQLGAGFPQALAVALALAPALFLGFAGWRKRR